MRRGATEQWRGDETGGAAKGAKRRDNPGEEGAPAKSRKGAATREGRGKRRKEKTKKGKGQRDGC